MTTSRERRIGVLERNHAPQTGGGVVILKDGETFDDAVKRLGLTVPGGYICVPEILSPEDWTARAKVQQAELLRGMPK